MYTILYIKVSGRRSVLSLMCKAWNKQKLSQTGNLVGHKGVNVFLCEIRAQGPAQGLQKHIL